MYDIIIIGGGLAGLINAISLSRAGLKVALFEKNEYPFHKVCGEYISNETLPFLQSLDVNPFDLGAVALSQFRLTSPQGHSLDLPLDLGGFGLSRYTLDQALYQKAQAQGVDFHLKTKVLEIKDQAEHKTIQTNHSQEFQTKVLIAAHGKRANVDNQLDRRFFRQRSPYLGIKYHIRTNLHPHDQIALHNFKDGYCGISRIEDGKFCLCYLTTRQNLKDHQGSISQMEAQLLGQNPHLQAIWDRSEFLYEKPLVINEISFAPKLPIEQGIFMCGDAAGLITPLCGNGMAMAIHGAKVLSELLMAYFAGRTSREKLESAYTKQWQHLFAKRLWAGRKIQALFGHPLLTEALLQSAKTLPPLGHWMVKQTHGRVF